MDCAFGRRVCWRNYIALLKDRSDKGWDRPAALLAPKHGKDLSRLPTLFKRLWS